MKTVGYASYCCTKDMRRVLDRANEHADSHQYDFDEKWFVFQRCGGPEEFERVKGFNVIQILDADYPEILHHFGIKYPDPVLDELTHGWGAPHFYAHHLVNLLSVLRSANTDYIVFADGDCYISKSPKEGPSWILEGMRILEADPSVFVVSPSDGRPHEDRDRMMSQQMFLINTKRFREMEFIPWDGKFVDGGPFQEFYGLLEGWIFRHMVKHDLYRHLLPPKYRWWHLEFH